MTAKDLIDGDYAHSWGHCADGTDQCEGVYHIVHDDECGVFMCSLSDEVRHICGPLSIEEAISSFHSRDPRVGDTAEIRGQTWRVRSIEYSTTGAGLRVANRVTLEPAI